MTVGIDAFQGLILRELLLEDGLREEFNYAQVASWLVGFASIGSRT